MNLWLSGVRGKVGRKTVKETGMDMYTLLHLKWMTSKDLLYTHGTLLNGTLLNSMWHPG